MSVAINYQPSLEVLWSAAFRKVPLIYLCWGLTRRRGLHGTLKTGLLREILRRAAIVAVNEPVTARDVRRLSGKVAVTIPFVVDTDFFSYAPPQDRRPFILVPGDIDRDESLVARLSKVGLDIVRVTRNVRILDRHRELGSSAKVFVNISWLDLRAYYQQCAAVFLPITAQNHPGGQTAMLEAFACGARIVVSKGRTAEVLPKSVSVSVVDLSDIQKIISVLKDRVANRGVVSDAEYMEREVLRRQYSFEACVNSYAWCISQLQGSSTRQRAM
jgi:hypothetical protein